ncbi:hypothetical protein [Pedobacter gandavensis]|uniref:Terminase small subunit n=1 Tax=Pedobacter gandavensis TaxID=2679963 RepID=A0ABR6EV69_9SPHI|nr:hypothetical protein [Pedobacter gandavensis]MBB2149168.1 hypothetical protein [Pedobacter gandavensis]
MSKLLQKDNNQEAIITYLRDPDADIELLSYKQKQLLDYYTDAYTVMRNYNSVPDAINILIKLSEKRGERISRSTARRYVYDAMDVFGYSSKIKREGILHYATEVMRDAIAMAKEQHDPKTMIMGAKEVAALNGADEIDGPNFDLLEPHVIEILLDPEAMKLIKALAGKGSLDLDTLMGNAMNSLAEDAVYVDPKD